MALFSRRRAPSPDPPVESDQADETEPNGSAAERASERSSPAPEPASDAEQVPAVGISMSAFGGVGAATGPRASAGPAASPAGGAAQAPTAGPGAAASAPAVRRGPAEAPPPSETIPGLADNVLLQAAVARFAAHPDATGIVDVARQLLQGQLFLRIKGDARALLAEGAGLPFAVAHRGEEQFAVVFSGGAALTQAVQADGDTETSALGQDSFAVLRTVLGDGHAGVVVDHWAGSSAPVLPRELLQQALEQADPARTVKTLLAAARTPDTAGAVAAALVDVPLWIAANRASEDAGWGIAESRTDDGRRYLEVFSHPLEVVAMGRGDQPMPLAAVQLGRALAGDAGLTGVVVDPAGPWIQLERDDLAPVLAAAADDAAAPHPSAASPVTDAGTAP